MNLVISNCIAQEVKFLFGGKVQGHLVAMLTTISLEFIVQVVPLRLNMSALMSDLYSHSWVFHPSNVIPVPL